MAKLPEILRIGSSEEQTIEGLQTIIERLYTDLAVAINRKPDLHVRDSDGVTTDTFLPDGDININSSTNKIEVLVSHDTSTSVTWKEI